MCFKSKVSTSLSVCTWIVLVAGAILGLGAYRILPYFFPMLYPVVLISNLISFAMIIFIAWSWLKTEYSIIDDTLLIQSGPLRLELDIHEITTIKKTRNRMSSPALSFDRLEVKTKIHSVIISPEDKEVFIRSLQRINGKIELIE